MSPSPEGSAIPRHINARMQKTLASQRNIPQVELQMWSLVSAVHPDWSREQLRPHELDPGKRLLASIREYQRWAGKPGRIAEARRAAAVLKYRFWSTVAAAEIPLDVALGGGLMLPHPNGVIIHNEVVIGPNCLIFQQVTLGTRTGEGSPILGGHVDVGAGAKILGRVHIGDHAKIGANAVVLTDVPAGATAVGNPARIVCRGEGQHVANAG